MNGNNKIHIIGEGSVGKYLKRNLDKVYGTDISIFSARLIAEKSKKSVNDILYTDDSIGGIVKKLKKGERYLYAGKSGDFLTILIDTIKKQCPENTRNFWIFGVNGLENYGDEFPRLVLNHAIKEKQVSGEKLPETFSLSGKSYFFLPNPTEEEKNFLGKVGFDIDIIENRGEFEKARLIKNGINVVFNGLSCVYQGILLRNGDTITKANIKNTIDFFNADFTNPAYPNYIKSLTDDLTMIYNARLAAEYGREGSPLLNNELYNECVYTYKYIPDVIVSSVKQLWGESINLSMYSMLYGANEENSDAFLLLGEVDKMNRKYKLGLQHIQILLTDFIDTILIDRNIKSKGAYGDILNHLNSSQ